MVIFISVAPSAANTEKYLSAAAIADGELASWKLFRTQLEPQLGGYQIPRLPFLDTASVNRVSATPILENEPLLVLTGVRSDLR